MTEMCFSPGMVAQQRADAFRAVVGENLHEAVDRMHTGVWLACQATVELGPEADVAAIRAYTEPLTADDWAIHAVTAVAAHEAVEGRYGTIVPERCVEAELRGPAAFDRQQPEGEK